MEYEQETRMAGDYRIILATQIARTEVVVGENPAAEPGQRYLVAYCETLDIFTRYSECLVSDDYAETMEIYGQRIADKAREAAQELQRYTEEGIIDVGKPILVIADLGLWTGRHSGYREITSGNISDCLYSNYDYTTWYVDSDGEFRCDDCHHDGTNHYLYRAFRKGVTEEQMHDLEDKIYLGTATQADIDRYTRRLGDDIGRVYGWSFPPKHRAEKQYDR